MKDSIISQYFGEAHAASYDERALLMKPIRDALNFLVRVALSELNEKAHILCVGAGTGEELLDLAKAFPHWTFTAVEPSEAMLNVCRKKTEDAGISSKVTFHQGYLDSLASNEPYDAATSILVSQFLTNQSERIDFFKQIAKRLKPNGRLINADLSSDLNPQEFETLFCLWLQAHGQTVKAAKTSKVGWSNDVAISAPKEIESIIVQAGFKSPIPFYQGLFIRAWFANLV